MFENLNFCMRGRLELGEGIISKWKGLTQSDLNAIPMWLSGIQVFNPAGGRLRSWYGRVTIRCGHGAAVLRYGTATVRQRYGTVRSMSDNVTVGYAHGTDALQYGAATVQLCYVTVGSRYDSTTVRYGTVHSLPDNFTVGYERVPPAGPVLFCFKK